MPFQSIADALKSFGDNAEATFNKMKDKNAFKRVVYAGYLIARADGDFSSDEKKTLVNLIKNKMPHFGVSDITKILDEAEESIAFDETFGLSEIKDEIAKSASNQDEAGLIMRSVMLIANADGNFDRNEKTIAREIAKKLKLQPSEFGL